MLFDCQHQRGDLPDGTRYSQDAMHHPRQEVRIFKYKCRKWSCVQYNYFLSIRWPWSYRSPWLLEEARSYDSGDRYNRILRGGLALKKQAFSTAASDPAVENAVFLAGAGWPWVGDHNDHIFLWSSRIDDHTVTIYLWRVWVARNKPFLLGSTIR